MGRYAAVFTKIWQDNKFRALDDNAKTLFLYLLTSPHGNLIGLYYMPLAYASADLGRGIEGVSKGLSDLEKAGMIRYDKEAQVVLIVNFLKYNPINNDNQAKGALQQLEGLPETPLITDFLKCVEVYCKPYLSHFEGVSKPLRSPLEAPAEGYRRTETVPVTETVTVTGNKKCHDSASAPSDAPPVPREPKFDEDSVPYQLALHLRNAILHRDPDTKVPPATPKGLESWAIEADRMLRIDGRDPMEAARLMEWAQNDSFWCANILSMSKFRKQYDKLKRQAQARGSPGRRETAVDRRLRDLGVVMP